MQRVAGVDEAGRGPLAGPLVVAAVVLDPAQPIVGIGDSKALSEAQREALFPQIIASAITYCIVVIEPEEIAHMVAYLASPLASATTGGALRVDGGYVDSIVP